MTTLAYGTSKRNNPVTGKSSGCLDPTATKRWAASDRPWRSLQWPSEVSPSTGSLYDYQFDAMGRLSTMLDSSGGSTLATASYGVANEVLNLTYFGVTETQTFNSRFQMISQTALGAMDMHNTYPTRTNCGPISSSTDNVLGETVNYTYDSLSQLSCASAGFVPQRTGRMVAVVHLRRIR